MSVWSKPTLNSTTPCGTELNVMVSDDLKGCVDEVVRFSRYYQTNLLVMLGNHNNVNQNKWYSSRYSKPGPPEYISES
jgi:hypothetical protein